MKALVTGGGGFLGSAIVRQLLARGDTVRSFSRGNYPELQHLGVETMRGDLGDSAAVNRAVAGVDVVFHTAAKPPPWGSAHDYERANVAGTQHVLDACTQHGVRDLVYTSSPSVVFGGRDQEGVDESVAYPARYDAHYPRTKALAEQRVLKSARENLRTISLRPHLIWGPGDHHLVPRIIKRAQAGQLRRVGRGKKIDLTYIDDAARAHLLAADALRSPSADLVNGKAYFITADRPIENWEMVDNILSAAGLPPVKRTVSPMVAIAAGTVLEATHRVFGLAREPRMTRFVARELSTAHWFDISAAKRDLGYQPLVTLDEGLARLAEWLATQHANR